MITLVKYKQQRVPSFQIIINIIIFFMFIIVLFSIVIYSAFDVSIYEEKSSWIVST